MNRSKEELSWMMSLVSFLPLNLVPQALLMKFLTNRMRSFATLTTTVRTANLAGGREKKGDLRMHVQNAEWKFRG
jgi:hypothetical protein